MIIKKFVGKNEIEATEMAKKELGDSMVIMNVRKVKPKGMFASFRAKQVEVTAALEDEEEPLRQIRRIAQAQVAAQEKVASAGKPVLTPKPAEDAKAAKETTEIPSENPAAVAPRNATAQDAKAEAIEKKLDSLQNLLETQFRKENDAVSTTKENARKAGATADGKPAEEAKKEETDPQTAEMDRFLKLLYNTMMDNEVDEKHANEIIREADRNRKPKTTMDFLLSTIYQKMILHFGKSEGIVPSSKGAKVVFFIGPTGVGKTTTIAKVASSISVNQKKKIAMLTTDTYRIAATDQLRTYASILGVPFRVVYTAEELAIAVEDFGDCDYIFVDTAGHSHKNEELLEHQKEYLDMVKTMAESQSFLVLSATTKYKDLRKIVDNYRSISDFQLIFTKLDETSSLGNLYNIRLYADAPIAYITTGQNVPDDIEVFNAQKIVKLLLGGKQ
jgi:flagellar biosynthesis protein FlhF